MKLNKIISSALIFVMLFASIVAVIPVTSLAAEEAAPVVSVLENDTKTEKEIKEICDNYTNYGFGEFDFATAEDCLQYELSQGYLDSVDYGNYVLYVNRYTGLIFYKNKVSGQIITSNPTDPAYATVNADNITSVKDNAGFLSQLELEYFKITDSAKGETLYNLTEILDGAFLSVKKIDGGFSVRYTLGEATDGFIAPGAVEAEDFRNTIAFPLFDALAAYMEARCGAFDAAFAKQNDIKIRDYSQNSAIKPYVLFTSYDLADQAVYENGELRMTSVSNAIDKLKQYAEYKFGFNTPIYNEISAYAGNVLSILSEYKAMIPEVIAEMEIPGVDDPLSYYAETLPLLKEGKTVYYMQENSDITSLRLVDRAMRELLPSYTLDDVKEDHDVVGFVSEYEDVASFKVTVNYKLSENGELVVDIPVNSIQFNDEVFAIKQITPLKYFGAADMNEDGYIFFPDGSGTVIEYSDFYFGEDSGKANTNMAVTGKIYGPDYCYTRITGAHREQITMPVWGMTATVNSNAATEAKTGSETNKQGFLAVIEKGSSLGTLGVASAPGTHKYAYSYSSFAPFLYDECDLSQTLSVSGLGSYTMVADGRYPGSIVTKYTMLVDETLGAIIHADGGDEYYAASYIGMAVCYRDSLKAAGVLTALTETYDELPLYIEALGSIDVTKKILSFPVTVSTPLTTFDDVERMYKELSDAQNKLMDKANEYKAMADELTRKEDESLKEQYLSNYKKYKALSEEVKNIRNINFRLKGFANGGMSFTYPSKVKFESAVGGKRGFKELVAYANGVNAKGNYNMGIYPDFDFQYIANTAAFDGITQNKDAARMVDNRFASKQGYDSITQDYETLFTLLLSSSSLDKLYTKFNKQYTKLGCANLSVSTLGSDLNSNLDEDNLIDRETALSDVTSLLSRMDSDYSLMTNTGNMYSIKYMDHVLGVSTDSSHFKYSSYTVPFIGMVLHGFVSYAGSALNYSGSPDYDILRSIESGASLYYILCCENTNYLKEDKELSQYYGIDYENWFEKIAEQYTKLDDAIGNLQKYNIVDHKIILAERVIERAEMERNYANLADEYSEAIDLAIAGAIDAAIKANREEGNVNRGVALNVDVESIVENFASAIHVDDADVLAAMQAIAKGETPTIEIESYISKNLLAVMSVIEKYTDMYPYSEQGNGSKKIVNYGGADVSYESLYSYVTDSYATEENYKYTDFTCDNGNVVMVTYRHPETNHEVKFILNYNNFVVDVRLAAGEEPIRLDAYAYHKITE
ncbi:MAG: hypothetical protein IJW66_03380 [Clostridia bacterium]|nr:hypothetical protein [Clostridia bacterium]